MKVAFFSCQPYDREYFETKAEGEQTEHELHFFGMHLTDETASITQGYDAVCCFVNDTLDGACLEILAANGVKLIAMRCAGFNNIDLEVADKLGLQICRVPAYSPNAVAEHSLALIMALNRRIHRAFNRVRENDFSLNGLMGFDIHGKTVGVVGTGQIGRSFIKLMTGFGCKILAFDPYPHQDALDMGVEYVSLETLFAQSDIISLHCPLMEDNYHLINEHSIQQMKKGVMIINTSRGALLDTKAIIEGLKTSHIGYLGLDVYEEEADLFFEDHSVDVLQDDVFARLITFRNVIVTGHQAFFTKEAMSEIAKITFENLTDFETDGLNPTRTVKS